MRRNFKVELVIPCFTRFFRIFWGVIKMAQKSIFCDLFVHLEAWGQPRVDLETFPFHPSNPLAFWGQGTKEAFLAQLGPK